MIDKVNKKFRKQSIWKLQDKSGFVEYMQSILMKIYQSLYPYHQNCWRNWPFKYTQTSLSRVFLEEY